MGIARKSIIIVTFSHIKVKSVFSTKFSITDPKTDEER